MATGYKKSIEIFNRHYKEYDSWYDNNRYAYLSELRAVKRLLPKKGIGVDIGAGTGRFAVPLSIRIGVEPAKKMAEFARKRGIKVFVAGAEKLPFKDAAFDFALMVTTLCFVNDPDKTLYELKRILKPKGRIILGIIDKQSWLGKQYGKRKNTSTFYKYARFYSVPDVLMLLATHGFIVKKIVQTIFSDSGRTGMIEPVEIGYGRGGFVVLAAAKTD